MSTIGNQIKLFLVSINIFQIFASASLRPSNQLLPVPVEYFQSSLDEMLEHRIAVYDRVTFTVWTSTQSLPLLNVFWSPPLMVSLVDVCKIKSVYEPSGPS